MSPTDAPLLERQFKPQFEAGNLLELHNRHFLIKMTIEGENAPAFTASTLTLPRAQKDNTHLIIENSRRLYSKSRETVEEEIRQAITPPERLQPRQEQKNPGTNSTSEVTKETTNSGTETAQHQPVKKKRRRSRARKQSSTPPVASSTDKSSDETVLKVVR